MKTSDVRAVDNMAVVVVVVVVVVIVTVVVVTRRISWGVDLYYPRAAV